MASCRPCSAGSYSNVLGADSCELCTPGFYANQSFSTACETCPMGRYGPQTGLAECEECPAGRTTAAFSAAITQDACQCQGHLYQGQCIVCAFSTRFESGQCVGCGEGLICNGSRSADIVGGYFTESHAPFSVYKCLPREFCPGGLPGTCANELIGVPCTHCPDGKTWDNNACQECTAFSLAGWFCATLFGIGLVPALYYMMNMRQTAKATTMLATSCALAMTISMVQNLGIIGYISFSWPSELQWVFDHMSIFTLDLEAIGFDCVSSSPVFSYMITSAVLPCSLLWLLICSFLSRLLPMRWRFESSKLVSTMAQFIQVSFTIYSKVALSPMMCYTHPNGRSSMLEHNGIFCFESEEHTPMFLVGLFLLGGMILRGTWKQFLVFLVLYSS